MINESQHTYPDINITPETHEEFNPQITLTKLWLDQG